MYDFFSIHPFSNINLLFRRIINDHVIIANIGKNSQQVENPAVVAPSDRCFGNVMAAFLHALLYTVYGKLFRIRQKNRSVTS